MTARYQTVRVDDVGLREGMKALAHKPRRFGYRCLHVLLRREGHEVNHKRLFRMYREDGGGSENSPGDCFPDDAACAAQGRPETGDRHAGADVGAPSHGLPSKPLPGSGWLQISSGRWILCRIN